MSCSPARQFAPHLKTVFARLRQSKAVSAAIPALVLTLLLVLPTQAVAQLGQSVRILDDAGEVVLDLDRAALEDLGRVEIATTTPWDDGVVVYEGPLLRDLMAHAGMPDQDIEVRALNEYSSIIPHDDIQAHDVILAVRREGDYMPVSDKGPAFILYPFDSDANLADRVYYARSVWQVETIRPVTAEGAR